MSRGRFSVWVAVIAIVLVGYGVFAVNRSAGRIEEAKQTEVTERALSTVSDPLAALCAENAAIKARVGAACDTAAQVISAPPEKAVDGIDGAAGMDGRGITATNLRSDGHLIISYSDGKQNDVGLVVGGTGKAGTGIASADLRDGHLVLTFTDGSTLDVGSVLGARGAAGTNGADGRSIKSTAIVEGRLIVSYSDGTTDDAGPVPPGPAGPPGELPTSYTNTYPDGTTQTCTRDGGGDSTPVYRCGERS